MRTYYSTYINKDLFGKPLYMIDIINYSENGNFIGQNTYEFHDKKSRNIVIESKNNIKVSKNILDKSRNTHIEPKKETRIISFKKYVKQLEKHRDEIGRL